MAAGRDDGVGEVRKLPGEILRTEPVLRPVGGVVIHIHDDDVGAEEVLDGAVVAGVGGGNMVVSRRGGQVLPGADSGPVGIEAVFSVAGTVGGVEREFHRVTSEE